MGSGTLGAGGTLRYRQGDWASLGVWVGPGLPTTTVTLEVWRAQRYGFWAYLDARLGIVPFLLNEATRESVAVVESVVSSMATREGRSEALGVSETDLSFLAMREVLAETGGYTESTSDTLSASHAWSEAASEAISVAAVERDLLAMQEARNEAVGIGEVATSTVQQREPFTDTVSVTEAVLDAIASADPFLAFWLSLPKPAPAGKYPVASGGTYVYRSANDILVSMLAASSPGDTTLWIDSSGT